MSLLVELVGLVLTALVLLAIPLSRRAAPLRALSRGFARFADHRGRAVVAVGVLALALNVGVSALAPPVPVIHDEFSYLLAADTFAQGRLTNPPHPMWRHFESFHIIHQPTYASKYPPAFALTLALGKALTGGPLPGLWLGHVLCCMAVCWMLQAWTRPRWALFVTLLFVLNAGVFTRFGQSYFGGGAIATLGAALVYGGLRRFFDKPRAVFAWVLAAGGVVLALSRPVEGLAVCLPAGALLVVWFARNAWTGWAPWRDLALPLTCALAALAAGQGYYNWRVTGDPRVMPYMTHERDYAHIPLFLWQSPTTPRPQRHYVIERFQNVLIPRDFEFLREARGYWVAQKIRLIRSWEFIFRFAWLAPLPLAAVGLWRSRWLRAPAAAALCVFAVLAAETFFQEHYTAPALAALLIPLTDGWRRLHALRRPRRWWGQRFVFFSACCVAITFALQIGEHRRVTHQTANNLSHRARLRQDLERQLRATPGKHLVMVYYRRGHNVIFEWVYNGADLENAPVVWARPMSAAENEELKRHYADRQIWLLDADAPRPALARAQGPPPARLPALVTPPAPADAAPTSPPRADPSRRDGVTASAETRRGASEN